MEQNGKIFLKTQNNGVHIYWKELPVQKSIEVTWRGEHLLLKIEAFKTQYGSTRIITFNYRDIEYPCSLTKWKYLGGGNGIYPPRIETESHYLKVNLTLSSMELTDMAKNFASDDDTANPFTITF